MKKLFYLFCREGKRKKNILLDSLNYFLFLLTYKFKKRNMKYFKGTIVDDYQVSRVAYRLVEYNNKTNQTVLENVIIFSKKYTRYLIDRKNNDCSSKWINDALTDEFTQSNEEEYKIDISNKKGEFNTRLGE